ncbi:MAG: hypothetical protein DME97_09935 [Verrucomicrobia bacterium]|nr:MAG: hypothetical protein DME97_09935 [Verrucomicrobiota bacterium]
MESADEAASWARQMNGAAKRTAAAMSHERFRITSYLQLFREADSLPLSREIASTALILLFAKKFFRAATLEKIRDQRSRLECRLE